MKTKYTPGPWMLELHEDDYWPRAIKTDESEHVTFVDRTRYADDSIPDPEALHNAYLMAAAPELYEACKAMLDGTLPGHEAFEMVKAAVEKAEAPMQEAKQ